MSEEDFIPTDEDEFVIWAENFIAVLSERHQDFDISYEEVARLKADLEAFKAQAAIANESADLLEKAKAEKYKSFKKLESKIRLNLQYAQDKSFITKLSVVYDIVRILPFWMLYHLLKMIYSEWFMLENKRR